MNRIFKLIFCCILFTSISNAQYTSVINANKPGNTETPYAVGTNVFQFENKTFLDNNEQNNIDTSSFGNEFNFRYGFWKERLEASLLHKFRSNEIGNRNITGTEVLALGLKYLVFDYRIKETAALTKSWKKRYGFHLKRLIPTVAVSAHINTPLNNSRFGNSGTSFSTAIITQNHISRKLRINNQFEYNFIGSDLPEFIYSTSGSYVLFGRFNPYAEFRFHQLSPSNADSFNYYSFGTGVPFLIHRDLSVAVNFNYNFGDVRGSEFGIHASYRIDKHLDRWITKKVKKSEDTIATQQSDIEGLKNKKQKFFSKIFSKFKKDKKEIAPKEVKNVDDSYNEITTEPKKQKFFGKIFSKFKRNKEEAKTIENSDDFETEEISQPKKRDFFGKLFNKSKNNEESLEAEKQEVLEKDNSELDNYIDEQSEQKRNKRLEKAKRKAEKAKRKQEAKRLKAEAKAKKKEEKEGKKPSFIDDFINNY